MLRERFDSIEIIDLRGDVRRGERAGVTSDQGVFNIQVGTAITLAIADRRKGDGDLAGVSYIDSWAEGLFARDSKFVWLKAGEETGTRPGAVEVARELLDDMKPEPFQNGEWPGLSSCFTFKHSGVQTKRDDCIYSFSHNALRERIAEFLAAPDDRARVMFHDSRDRKWVGARAIPFDGNRIVDVGYRPHDNRYLYNHAAYGDFLRPELQSIWGANNVALYAMPFATGAGPAAWCHGLLPDYHAFSGRGGYAFPLPTTAPVMARSTSRPASTKCSRRPGRPSLSRRGMSGRRASIKPFFRKWRTGCQMLRPNNYV